MDDFKFLRQWAEPDGDNDQLYHVRMEVQALLNRYDQAVGLLRESETKLVTMPTPPSNLLQRIHALIRTTP